LLGVSQPSAVDEHQVWRLRRWLLATVVVLLCAGCGSPSAEPRIPAAVHDPTTAGLRAAARAWSAAFLTGTVSDIEQMEGGSCHATGNPTFLTEYLRGLRAALQHHLGVSLDKVRVTGVLVRQMTVTTGDADVQYNLPASVVGNDNWVTYQYQGGQWRETSCHAPIGGESTGPVGSAS
jgi:hypothetical protein